MKESGYSLNILGRSREGRVLVFFGVLFIRELGFFRFFLVYFII